MRADFIKALATVKRRLRNTACRKLRDSMQILFKVGTPQPAKRAVHLLFCFCAVPTFILLCLAALLTACRQSSTQPAPATQVFTVKGVIKELEPDGKTAVIRHEAIPGYMEAMTMPFEVRDTNLLRGLQAGDSISFQLAVTPSEGWIQAVTKLSSVGPEPAPAPPAMRVTRALEPLDEGDRLPDYHFTNELGGAVSLSQFKGQVLAFTFFFTSCPFPEYCPRVTSQFGQAEKQLEKMTNAPAQWHLLSISFDPARDTPPRLATYALLAKYDKSRWNFLTGDEDQISGLAEQMGENYWREGDSIGHNLRTVVVDPAGRIRHILGGSKWTVEELVQDIVEAGAAKGEGPK
jgi:protein SCO1